MRWKGSVRGAALCVRASERHEIFVELRPRGLERFRPFVIGVDVDIETEDGVRPGVCEGDAAALTRRTGALQGPPLPIQVSLPCERMAELYCSVGV